MVYGTPSVRVWVGLACACGGASQLWILWESGPCIPACTHGLTHNGYTGRIMDPTGVSSGAKLTLDEPGLVCRTIMPLRQQRSQNTVTPGSIRVCVPRPPWLGFGVPCAVLVLGHPK